MLAEALADLPLPPVRMQVNNRKVSQGFFRGLGLEDLAGVLRTVDKLDKIGPAAVATLLRTELSAQRGAGRRGPGLRVDPGRRRVGR